MSEQRNNRKCQADPVLHNPEGGLFPDGLESSGLFLWIDDPSVRSVGTASSVLGHKAVSGQLEKVVRLRWDR
jgi:hypothetical protein